MLPVPSRPQSQRHRFPRSLTGSVRVCAGHLVTPTAGAVEFGVPRACPPERVWPLASGVMGTVGTGVAAADSFCVLAHAPVAAALSPREPVERGQL